MSRILVVRGGAIGDFILTLPALRLLREAFPAAHLEILGYQHIVALAQMSGYANATRSIEYAGLASFFSRDGELAPELMEYFGSFRQIVSYLFDPDEIFAANLKRSGVRNFIAGSPKITDQEHAARQLARPLERLALYLDDAAAVLTPPGTMEVGAGTLAIHPGSGSERKNWPIERFAEVAAAWLLPNEMRKLVLVGGEADGERLDRLRALLPNERIELAQNLPLTELAARLRNCGLFLGHDSGVSHLAAAIGTPAVLLFGPTEPDVWAPLNPRVRVLRASCLTMSGISVAAVVEALRDESAGWKPA
ncbi:MAG: glycosyltransferase family 9 protein [Chthoniobacterales bacterium]|nr:glycosyltransferase family 9 protein [Chthoniobacterales bacterium]